MDSDGSVPIDWVALRGWYLSADEVLTIFGLCCMVAQAFIDGDAVANLRGAELLSGLTTEAERWLLAHPCPARWNGNWVLSAAQLFATVSELIVVTGGYAPKTDDGRLTESIDKACATVADIRELVVRIGVAPSL